MEFKATQEEFRSTIAFDESGICDACRYLAGKDQGSACNHREEQLFLFSQWPSSHKGYNIVVPERSGEVGLRVIEQAIVRILGNGNQE